MNGQLLMDVDGIGTDRPRHKRTVQASLPRRRESAHRTLGGELLRMYRVARGLTQAGMGRLLGRVRPCSVSQVSAWELGRVVPLRQTRVRIARITRGLVGVDSWLQRAETIAPLSQGDLLPPAPPRCRGTATQGAQP